MWTWYWSFCKILCKVGYQCLIFYDILFRSCKVTPILAALWSLWAKVSKKGTKRPKVGQTVVAEQGEVYLWIVTQCCESCWNEWLYPHGGGNIWWTSGFGFFSNWEKRYDYTKCYSCESTFIDNFRLAWNGKYLRSSKFSAAFSPQLICHNVIETCAALLNILN